MSDDHERQIPRKNCFLFFMYFAAMVALIATAILDVLFVDVVVSGRMYLALALLAFVTMLAAILVE